MQPAAATDTNDLTTAHGSAEAAHPHPNYLGVFYLLCLLTAVSVVADVLGGGVGKVAITLIVMAVACAKAMFVMLYFMHLKFEGPWKYALLAPTITLAIGIVVTLGAEFCVHYYDWLVPYLEPVAEPVNAPAAH